MNYPPEFFVEQHDSLVELMKKIKIDYDNNPLTKEPPFEEPKQFDIGFIPTIEQLNMAFQQMPSGWPGDTYRHELKTIIGGFDSGGYPNEKLIGILTFNKIDGQWVYFGPTKYK